MFKDISELKSFILWAKDQKIKRLKVGECEAEFSDLVHVEEMITAPETKVNQEQQQKEDEELLFWSSRP